MEGNQQRWKQLAALAAQEQDPERLLQLIGELNSALNEKHPLTSHSAEEPLPRDNVKG
jgi:hypothetical protein